MKKFADKPYIILDIKGENIWFSILVNDIPVHFHYEENYAYTSFELPVNDAMSNGKNKIEFSFIAPTDENGEIEDEILQGKRIDMNIGIIACDFDTGKRFELGRICYNAPTEIAANNFVKTLIAGSTSEKYLTIVDGKLDELEEDENKDEAVFHLGEPVITADDKSYYGADFRERKIQRCAGVSVSTTLDLIMPYDNMKLTAGEKITNDVETRQELIDIHKRIIAATEEEKKLHKWPWSKKKEGKGLDVLKSMFEPVKKNQAVFLYCSEDETDTLPVISKTAKDKDYIIPEPKYKNSYLMVFGNDRQARLTYWRSNSVFAFNLKGGGCRKFNLTFSKINGEWKVV